MILLFGAAAMLGLSACGGESAVAVEPEVSEVTESTVKNEAEVTVEIGGMGSLVKVSDNFEDACDYADLIMELRVTEISPQVLGGGVIHSYFKPEVIEIYKGEYHDEDLIFVGGEMPFEEYYRKADDLTRQSLNQYSDEERAGLLRYQMQYCEIPHEGDRIIFFGRVKEDEPGCFISSIPPEAIFPCDGDTIHLETFLDCNLLPELKDRFSIPEQSAEEVTVLDKAAFLAAIPQ